MGGRLTVLEVDRRTRGLLFAVEVRDHIVHAPTDPDHRFHSKPITDSARSRSPVPIEADHL